MVVVLLGMMVGLFFYNPFANNPHNLLLLSVDTLRHDHLGYAGHSRPTSPNLDELAKEGVVFLNAFSQSGWTLPSMATILTGRYPQGHGATYFHRQIDKRLPTLATILREHGYDTRGYVSHVVLTPQYGFNKGFMEYDYSVLSSGNPHNVATSRELTDLALKSLEEIKEPFFLWVHYFDPHFKYLSHQKWAFFGNSDIDRYDQEIALTDYHLGRLLNHLRQSHLDSRTIVIFTSDHGEEFGEHGGQYHYTSYQEVMRVPLIIKAPFLRPGVNSLVAEQIDFLPTILEMLKIETAEDYPGKDLFGEVKDNRPVFIERDRPPGFKQRAVIHGDYKLIRIEETDVSKLPAASRATFSVPKNVHPGTFLFNLSLDPKEKKNIFSQDSLQAEKILAMLAAHFTGTGLPVEKVELDEEMRQKLRSLGYLP